MYEDSYILLSVFYLYIINYKMYICMHYGDLGDLLRECPTVLQVKCIASVVLKQHCERYHLFFYHVVTLVGRLSCCLTSRLIH